MATKELINDRHSSYASEGALLYTPNLEAEETNPFACPCPSINTIASCKDFPIPSHPVDFFKETEQEYQSQIIQALQVKQKKSFLQRMSLTNIKAQAASLPAKIKDTLTSWREFFTENKNEKKSPNSSRTSQLAKNGSTAVPQQVTKVSQNEISQALPHLSDTDHKYVQAIKDEMASYAAELQKPGGGSITAMNEMLSRIVIMLARLGLRLSKEEMAKIFDHLEKFVKKRKETFEGRRVWTHITVAMEGLAAILSFGALAGGFLGNASLLGKTFTNLAKVSQPVGTFAGGLKSFDDMKEQHKAGLRTEYEHISDKDKAERGERDRRIEKEERAAQEAISSVRNALQALTDAKKRAIG